MTPKLCPTFGYAISPAEHAKRVKTERLHEQTDGIRVRTPATFDGDRQRHAANAARDAEQNDRPGRRNVRRATAAHT